MVIHYPPARLRSSSDQPTAITNVLVATSGSSYHTREIPLGHADLLGPHPPRPLGALPQRRPGCGRLARRGPGRTTRRGAGELDRLGSDGHDEPDRGAAWAIRQFLTDPAAHDAAVWSSTRTPTWSSPAVGYWLSAPTNQPGHRTQPPASRPGAPTPVLPIPLPDPSPQPTPARAA